MTDKFGSKPKILCVDDEPAVIDALVRLLRTDFDVLTAASGEEGLRLVEQHPNVAIILSDFRMGNISGNDFLRKARIKAPNAVRAILSGQIDLQQISEAINRAEIHRLILKPWDNDYLLIQMREALLAHSTFVERDLQRQLAITDPVTGLTNHRYFQERLQKEWGLAMESGKDLSLLMIDIDNFKICNDLYGHLAGDQILADVSNRIKKHAKESEALSRYGGEEFTLLLPGVSAAEARQRAEEIRADFSNQPIHISHLVTHPLTLSIGVSTQSKSHTFEVAPQLIAAADTALFQSKGAGRNQVTFASPTHDLK